ncbi:SigB/SigF/SigG family RNA polymerase sigma factor [Streptomyces sp. NPDC048191]|uniref:SigB/SigF/SigG family RNA polymerase sigma factor n=1 Tax=Streptomyces sp. NPDC048191 TaxID=3155484 RepID=UPI0033EB530F
MNPPTTLRPPGRHEPDGALTSPRIDEVVRGIGRHPPGRERDAARERAIRTLIPVARRIAAKYRNSGVEEQDDLFQVACVGLVKAVDGYDPGHGHAFLSYAVPTITGELKRHFRDRTGLVRLPRAVQEAGQQVRRVRRELEQRGGGRPPTLGEIARACGLSEDAVAEAVRSQDAVRPRSLDAPPEGRQGALPAFGEVFGDRDARIETVAERVPLVDALRRFPERERRILVLRFFHDRTQQQIAATVGISQMHVSRLLTRCLAQLRETVGHLGPARPAEGRAGPEAAAEGAGHEPARAGDGHGRVRGKGPAREDVDGRRRQSAASRSRGSGPGRQEPLRLARGVSRRPIRRSRSDEHVTDRTGEPDRRSFTWCRLGSPPAEGTGAHPREHVMTLVADHVRQRLERGTERVYECPGDGIDGLLGAFDRAPGEPESIQTRHEETAAFTACAHAKFTAGSPGRHS